MILWIGFQKALMITAFVAVMMITIEYVNVVTRGRMIRAFEGYRHGQYIIAVLPGISPGCLGAFVVVTLYIHQRISLGAVVAGMIATSGDEIFVMLAEVGGEPETTSVGYYDGNQIHVSNDRTISSQSW